MSKLTNIPSVKCGIISVSRDCFIISLSENRRKAIVDAYSQKYGELYEVQKTVEIVYDSDRKILLPAEDTASHNPDLTPDQPVKPEDEKKNEESNEENAKSVDHSDRKEENKVNKKYIIIKIKS